LEKEAGREDQLFLLPIILDFGETGEDQLPFLPFNLGFEEEDEN
jgi:hypothetical protein